VDVDSDSIIPSSARNNESSCAMGAGFGLRIGIGVGIETDSSISCTPLFSLDGEDKYVDGTIGPAVDKAEEASEVDDGGRTEGGEAGT
jgi:hypothetical protein